MNLFTKHPNEVDETYFEHGKFAACCGFKLMLLGLVAIIHAIFPFLFETTVRLELKKLDECFKDRFKKEE